SPSFTPDLAGSYGISVTVTDANGVSSPAAATSAVAVNEPVVTVIAASPSTGEAGQSESLSATVSGGVGTISYQWSLTRPAGSTAVLSSATAALPSFAADKAGTYLVSLVVTDANGVSSLSASLSITVNQALAAGTIGSSPAGPTAGTLTITVGPGAATALVLSRFPSTISAGVQSSFNVVAQDAYGNTASGYAGTLHFSSSDTAAVLPPDSSLAGGSGSFNATFNTP